MNCERFSKLIDDYLDDELANAQLAEFHAHRLACRRCGRAVSMLEAAGDVIGQDRSEPRISADFADSVVAEVPAALRAGRRSAWLVRATASVAGLAAAAAITLAVVLSQQLPAEKSQRPGHVVAGAMEYGVLDASCLAVLADFETMVWMDDLEP